MDNMEDLSDDYEDDNDVKPNWEDIRIPSPELEEQQTRFANYSSKKSSANTKIMTRKKSTKSKSRRHSTHSTDETLDICSNCERKFKSKDMICEIFSGDNTTPEVSNQRALVYVYELNGRGNYNLAKESVFLQHNQDKFPLCLRCSSSLTEAYKSLKHFSNLCRLGSIIGQKLKQLEALQARFYKISNYSSEETGLSELVTVKLEPEDYTLSDEEGHTLDDANNSDTSANYETTKQRTRRFQPEAPLFESSRPKRTVKKRSYFDFDTFSNDGSDRFSAASENEDFYETNTKNKKATNKRKNKAINKLKTRSSSKSDKSNDSKSVSHASEDSRLDIDKLTDLTGTAEWNSKEKSHTSPQKSQNSKSHRIRKKSHICPYCFKQFTQSRSLRSHIRFHTDEGNDELTCKVCGHKFSRKYHLNRHMKSLHSKNKNKISPRKNDEQNSNLTSPTSSGKILMTNNNQEEAADDCLMDCNDDSMTNTSSDKEDIKIDKQKPTKKTVAGLKNVVSSCPHCDKMFMTVYGLRAHMRIHSDADNDKLTCQICSKKFTREHHVTRHMKTHLGKIDLESEQTGNDNSQACNTSSSEPGNVPKKYVKPPVSASCEFCGQEFRHLGNLRRHIRTHTNENEKLTCYICDKKFSRKEHLKRHLNTVHWKERNNLAIQNTNENDNIQSSETAQEGEAQTDSLMCEYCSKSFINSFSLRRHLKKHLEYEDNDNLTCNVCSKIFSENRHLVTHMKSIHNIDVKVTKKAIFVRKCPVCSEEFDCNLSDFEEHVKTHGVESLYSCDKCTKTFCSYKYLQQHVFRKHNEQNEKFACQVCGAEFERCKLIKHQRERHFVPNNISMDALLVFAKLDEQQEEENDDTFSCSVCSKVYYEKKHLTAHMLKHTSEAPYNCDVCSKGFFLKRSMDRHMLLHSNENPFSCATCGKGYTRADHLKVHIEKVH